MTLMWCTLCGKILRKLMAWKRGKLPFIKKKRYVSRSVEFVYINAVFITARSHMRPGTIVLFPTRVLLNQGTAITLWGLLKVFPPLFGSLILVNASFFKSMNLVVNYSCLCTGIFCS